MENKFINILLLSYLIYYFKPQNYFKESDLVNTEGKLKMVKPRDQTREEMAAEGYVDTDSSDVKITTNVEAKNLVPLADTAKKL